VVTLCLIALNTAIFLYELSLSSRGLKILFLRYGVVPDQYQLIDLFTSMFLHGGWLHLIGNMWFLWIFGNNVEDSMGHVRFLAFYLLCGIAAAAAQVAVDPRSVVPMVGASGAISGVMGAYIVLYPQVRVHMFTWFILPFRFVIPAWLMLGYWFLLQVLGGLPALEAESGGVAFWAHAGGFVSGMLLVWLFRDRDLVRRRTRAVSPYGWVS
jgi:membrane associated rhomboid family serine protease